MPQPIPTSPVVIARRRVAVVLFFATFAFFFTVRYADFLRCVQNYALVTPTRAEFVEFARTPGGALEFATLFLAQFFYFPAVGGILLAGLYTTIFALGRRLAVSFGKSPDWAFYWALFPPVFTAFLFINVNLNAFSSTAGTFYLAPSLAVCIAFLIASAYRMIKSSKLRRAAGFGVAFGAFPLLGSLSFLAIFLILAVEFAAQRTISGESEDSSKADQSARPKTCREFWRFAALSLLIAGFAPLVWRALCYPTYDVSRLYWAALKNESNVAFGADAAILQNWLYISALVSAAACVALPSANRTRRETSPSESKALKSAPPAPKPREISKKSPRRRSKTPTVPQEVQRESSRKSFWRLDFQLAPPEIIAVLFLFVVFFAAAPRDENYFATLKLAAPLDAQDWERILEKLQLLRK
ncbi:MAG: hypothetical protein HUK22_08845, partial [Thermoguttaceae bacterium]|nr:hypothetical protein [Thermoguttaceae bacterium]